MGKMPFFGLVGFCLTSVILSGCARDPQSVAGGFRKEKAPYTGAGSVATGATQNPSSWNQQNRTPINSTYTGPSTPPFGSPTSGSYTSPTTTPLSGGIRPASGYQPYSGPQDGSSTLRTPGGFSPTSSIAPGDSSTMSTGSGTGLPSMSRPPTFSGSQDLPNRMPTGGSSTDITPTGGITPTVPTSPGYGSTPELRSTPGRDVRLPGNTPPSLSNSGVRDVGVPVTAPSLGTDKTSSGLPPITIDIPKSPTEGSPVNVPTTPKAVPPLGSSAFPTVIPPPLPPSGS
jgi:hypothetical protein